MKDIFNPDSYTEEAMPIATALCRAMDELGDLGRTSSGVKACTEKYKDINKQFFNSLTKEQKDLYVDVQWGDMEESALEIREYFNRGFRFAMLLMKEMMS